MEMTTIPMFPLILLGAVVLLLAIFFYYVPFLLWISAKVSGVNISLLQLFLMRIRKVPPYVIAQAMIEAHKAGLKTLTRDELEAHYLAGGHVEKVVHALVSASKANIDLSALTDKLHTNNGTATTNTITVDVQANNRWSSEDESTNLTYTLVCNKPEFSVAVQPGNCWSREFTIDEVQVTGNADVEKIKANLVYQYYNGTDWVECSTRDNVTGRTQQYSSAAEEIAEKTYKVRALYRGAIASAEVDATLEIPEQLPNGNMDQWSYETYTGNRYLFNPWSDGGASFWDTNNDYTTRHRHNSSSATMANYNGFHAVSYVAGRSGLAAEL